MERYSSSSRLYSGPLSQSAQKILEALRAQSVHSTRNHHRQMERYSGSQREHQSQGSWSRTLEDRRDVTDRPWSRPQSFSSSHWNYSTQRESSQTPAHSQYSQSSAHSQSSQRESSHSPAYLPSRALLFSQREVSQNPAFSPEAGPSTTRDRYTLSLQTPHARAQHQDTPWRHSPEELEANFTLTFSPEGRGPDEIFSALSENPDPHREEPAWACDPAPSRAKISLAPDNHTSEGQGESWPNMIDARDGQGHEQEDNIAQENQHKGQLYPCSPTEEADTGGDVGVYQGSGLGTTKYGGLLLPHRGDISRKETGYETQVPEIMSGQSGEGVRQAVDLKKWAGVERAQGVERGHGIQNGADGGTWPEIGDGDRGLLLGHSENGSTNGKEGDLVRGNHGDAGSERSLFPISIADQMDATFDCDTEDTDLHQRKGNDFRLEEHTSEREGFEHQLVNENKEVTEEPSNDIHPETSQVSVERKDRDVAACRAETPQNAGEPEAEPGEIHHCHHHRSTEVPLVHREPTERKLVFGDVTANQQRKTKDDRMDDDAMEGKLEVESEGKVEVENEARVEGGMEERQNRPDVHQQRKGQGEMEEGGVDCDLSERARHSEEGWKGREDPLMMTADRTNGGRSTEVWGTVGRPTPRLSQERAVGRGSWFRAPRLCGNPVPEMTLHHQDKLQAGDGGARSKGSSVDPTLATPSASGKNFSSKLGSATVSSGRSEERNLQPSPICSIPQQPPLIPTFALKRKHEAPPAQNASPPLKISLSRRPVKWEAPCSFQGRTVEGGGEGGRGRGGGRRQEGARTLTSTPKHPGLIPAFAIDPRVKASPVHTTESPVGVYTATHNPKQPSMPRQRPGENGFESLRKRGLESTRDGSGSEGTRLSKTSKPAKQKRAKSDPDGAQNGLKNAQKGASGGELQNQSKASCLTTAITSDPRVKDAKTLSQEERVRVLEEAGQARALVLTMVYQDGTTQLDPEQKLTPSVCGLLVLMKTDLDQSGPEDLPGPEDSLLYLKLEHTPAWAQQHTHHSQEVFTREMLLQVLSGSQLVVCFKAKDLLRTALQHYRPDLNWKQVAGCHIQDPQVSGWLLDPTDPASCYQDLLNKHCSRPLTTSTPALGTKKVSQVISSLSLLYWLNMELCSKLQREGLWKLYSNMELRMTPVLAAMESHRIHVDKEALKRTSDMLGTKLKQLEQEAHQAAGQMFLVSSSTQLRTVLFEKLRLHERCENKRLPKTINKQQQSTSEATLLQLQDLHPLPKIILEYRQVHKIKSTFVDGILSCMVNKNYISSTWCQTSAVTGRISAKHPNFQALPRQPVQITKKQYIQGKDAEVVTVHPRTMIIPQEGWTFLAADFCQVELRLLAHLSSDPELLRIFSNPQADIFTMLASQWKGVNEAEVTSEEREHAKRIVYSVVYGAGRERLSGILGVSAEQASRFQDSFLQTYREVQSFIQRTIQQCHKQGYVVSIMGRRRTLPRIHSPDWGVRMQAERQAVNFVVQGSAADLCKMAMIRIFSLVSSSSSLSARLIAQLHDELLYEVEDCQVEQFAALVKSTMESLQHVDCLGVHLKVPLKVAVSSGKSWGSMAELTVSPTSPSLLL